MPEKAANERLATYLNDHLAGSVVAIDLIAHLMPTNGKAELASFLTKLETDIKADRKLLEAMMTKLSIKKSHTRQAAAWVTEKALQAKMWMDDTSGGPLAMLEILETLSLGVEGKRLLWCSLEGLPQLQVIDFSLLKRRAVRQRTSIESLRLKAVKEALR